MQIRLTKAMLEFLRQVEAGGVYRSRGYTKRRGGYERFVGGETRAKKAEALGLITMPGVPDLGRPSRATLTDAGRAALAKEGK